MAIDIQTKANLIATKVDILALKADDYRWQCTIPVDVKRDLDRTLIEIDEILSKADENIKPSFENDDMRELLSCLDLAMKAWFHKRTTPKGYRCQVDWAGELNKLYELRIRYKSKYERGQGE